MKHFILGAVLACAPVLPAAPATEKPAAQATVITSLAELATAAAQSGQKITMKPGLYRLADFIPLSSIEGRNKRKEWQFIDFSGSHNQFDLTGVTIELDTALRQALRAPIHTDEFLISGGHVELKGLTITSVGVGTAYGGSVLGIVGSGTVLRDCTIHVQGSSPYGYGDLFGKGGRKHSGVHITGSNTRILGCKVFMRSFGHAFYMQEDCNDLYFENCHAEGVMRSTTEMLKETNSFAAQKKFQTEVRTHAGDFLILPGYMKALCEDGFRTYGQHKNLTLKNCRARNMRGGFELRTKTTPRLEGCTATGCERAFWVSNGAVMTRCKGDARHGPLLFVEGDDASVMVELLPAMPSDATVHELAAIYGSRNKVLIKGSGGRQARELPILLGYTPPAMGTALSPVGQRDARGVSLRNETRQPVVIGEKAAQCEVITSGPVRENLGKDIQVIHLR